MAPITLVHLLFLPGHWDRANVRSLGAQLHVAMLTHGAGGTSVGRRMDPCPEVLTPQRGFCLQSLWQLLGQNSWQRLHGGSGEPHLLYEVSY